MKLPKIFHRKHTMSRRLTTRVILTMTVVFTLILAVVFFLMWAVGAAGVIAYNKSIMETSNEKINNIFSAVEVAVSNNIPEVEVNIGNEKHLYDAQENLLKLNPNIVGAAIAYNPRYEPKKGQPFAPYAYRDSMGIQTKQLNGEDYDYLHQDWYEEPIKKKAGVWSEPYIDEGGGGIPMITYALPVLNEHGQPYAVQTADISLGWLERLVKELDSTFIERSFFYYKDESEDGAEKVRSFSFILTDQGHFAAHSDKRIPFSTNIQEYLKDFGVKNVEKVAKKIMSNKAHYKAIRDKNDHAYILFYAPITHTGWTIATAVPLWGLLIPMSAFIGFCVFLMLVGLGIVGLVCRITIRRITRPLTLFANSADEIAQGNLLAELPIIKTKDEMLQLRNSFETMQTSLLHQIEQVKTVNAEKGRMESELQIARNIQMSMLPKNYPPFPERHDIDLYSQLTPAREVGGDLYDYFIRDEKLFFCIGDVSGKGIPASLLMCVTRSLFRNIASHTAEPGRIMDALNKAVSDSNDSDMFVTVFIGVLDLPTGRLRYCNGGHNAPLLIGKLQGIGFIPCEPNLPIGIEPGWRFVQQELVIDPQTLIFLYTDGLTEAEDIRHNQFQEERVTEVAQQAEHQPKAFVEAMTEAVSQFVGNAVQSDDLTMVCIQYAHEHQKESRLQRSLTLSNNIDEIPQLAVFVDEVCEAIGFDMSTAMSLNLALEEAVVNVMDYAYPGTKGDVEIEAMANEVRLKFIITDHGIPFDPTAQQKVDTSLSAEERPIGGLGIHMVREIMDSINYERIDGKNILTLRKKFKTNNTEKPNT